MFLESRNDRTKMSVIRNGNVIRKPCPHRCEERGTEWQDPNCDGMCQGELGHTHPHHICGACNPFWGLDKQERLKEGVIKEKERRERRKIRRKAMKRIPRDFPEESIDSDQTSKSEDSPGTLIIEATSNCPQLKQCIRERTEGMKGEEIDQEP